MALANDQVVVAPEESYPNFGIYSFGGGVFAKPDIDGSSTSTKTLNRVHAGQFIYSRLFAFEGAYASVPPGLESYYVSSEFPAFDTNPEQLDARWLATFLRSPKRWDELRKHSKGLGVRRQRVPAERVMDYELWLPPIDTQRAMVVSVEQLEKVASARRAATERIDALLSAALNQELAGIN